MTVRREAFTASENARPIAYRGEEYEDVLQRMFDGAISKEDILSSLGMPWTKIASGSISSTNQYFTFKNLSADYMEIRIFCTGVLVDSTTNASLGIITSTDNGVNFAESASNYGYGIRISNTSSATLKLNHAAGTSILFLDGTTTNENLGATAASGEEATLDISIKHPMSASVRTTIQAFVTRGDTSGNFVYSEGMGTRNALESNNAIAIVTNSARTWASGQFNMYGLRSAS